MLRTRIGASRGLRWGILALAAGVTLVAVTDQAEARRYRRYRAPHVSSYQPAYAAIVVDANSGKVMHEANADSLRHPASLTKIMTLYLLFEQLEAGKLKLDSEMEVSEEAASQAPTKLGLKPGRTIAVEDAIKALVTRSANDAAVVIAEAIGGDEESFAKLMTRKARALGMNRTIYRNASGLPDDAQVTTARDQALLGRAIQDRFPRYYRYFATTSFSYRGESMRNHNHLLGRVEGVDGIKTGYTRSSGFNLVTSVRRGNRHIVAVVLGGASAGSRDARMRTLIDEYVDEAATKRTVARIGETPGPAEPQPAPRTAAVAAPPAQPLSPPPERAEAPSTPAGAAVTPQPRPGSNEPLHPIPVRTLSVKPAPVQTAALAPLPASTPAPLQAPLALSPPPTAPAAAAPAPTPATTAQVPPPGNRPGVLGVLPGRIATASADPAVMPAPPPAANAPNAPDAHRRGGWLIQIGAFPQEDEAKQRLQLALSKARSILASADPFTERVVKGDETLYRARFAGFIDKDRAEAACKYLKRNDFACLALKN